MEDKISKLIMLCSMLGVLVLLSILYYSPKANIYEISIYDAYPKYFWLILILSIYAMQMLVFYKMIKGRDDFSRFPQLITILLILILIFMPAIRGYYIYGREDTLTHLGYEKDIIVSGHLGATNYYPIDHLLCSTVNLVSLIQLTTLTTIIPQFITIFYFVSFYLLVRFLLKNESIAPALLFGFIPLYSSNASNTLVALAPYNQSFLFLPFLIYLYLKKYDNNKIEYSLLLVFLLFSIVYFHPLNTILVIQIFIIIEVSRYIIRRFHLEPLFSDTNNWHYGAIAIAIIAFLSWQSYIYMMTYDLKVIYNWLIGEASTTEFLFLKDRIVDIDFTPLELGQLIIYSYGHYIILFVICFLLAIYLYLFKKRKPRNVCQIFSIISLSYFLVLTVMSFASIYIFGFARLLLFAAFSSILFIASHFNDVVDDLNKNKKFLFLISLAIIIMTYISIYNTFFSPIVKVNNDYVMESEIDGMKSFLENRNESIKILELGISSLRFHELLYGRERLKSNLFPSQESRPPDHFKYDKFNSSYISVSQMGRLFYSSLYKGKESHWKFTPNDFVLLENEKGISKIYKNGCLDIYSYFYRQE